MFSFFGGGHGGHPEGDGLNHGNAPISTAAIPPAEILETAYPVMFTQWALRPNSGGAGHHRGGLGTIYEIELLEEQADVLLFGERGKFAPPGVLGGQPAAMDRFTYEQDDGMHTPPMVSKMVGISIKRGQRLHLETPGGGGFGPPFERNTGAVLRDLALGYIDRDNARPTVTDANVVLGRINADRPIGGKLARLDVDAARAAIDEHVAKPLGLGVMQGAEAIIRVANSRMAGVIRLVSIERGFDPKRFSALPFGGGGALHAGALMQEVGLQSALVPRYPGINSALGCTIADMRHDFVQTVNGVLEGLDMGDLGARMDALAQQGLDLLAKAGVAFGGTEVRFEMDMSYLGQTHTVDVPLPLAAGDVTGLSRDMIRAAFETRYRAVYGNVLKGVAMRVLNCRVSAIGKRPKFDLTLLAPADGVTLDDARTGTRDVWIDGALHETAIYDRLPLSVGVEIPGPAILEQPDTTIFIEPDLTGRVDRFGNLVITRKQDS